MERKIAIAWMFSLAVLGAVFGSMVTTAAYNRILAQSAELAEDRLQICEDRADNRLIAVLQQVDMECFGTWTTADGEITLYPDKAKK